MDELPSGHRLCVLHVSFMKGSATEEINQAEKMTRSLMSFRLSPRHLLRVREPNVREGKDGSCPRVSSVCIDLPSFSVADLATTVAECFFCK